MNHLWVYLQSHPGATSALTLFGYHVVSAFIGSLPMPDSKSSNLYRFFFNFANVLAANYARAKVSNGPVGQLPPKEGV